MRSGRKEDTPSRPRIIVQGEKLDENKRHGVGHTSLLARRSRTCIDTRRRFCLDSALPGRDTPPLKTLIIDLNNFSRYPTLSVGYAASILRGAGVEVEIFSPLTVGVAGYPRKTRPRPWGMYDHWLRYWSATSSSQRVRRMRKAVVHRVRPTNDDSTQRILDGATRAMTSDVDVILISAYTMYFDVCSRICEAAGNAGIPVCVGGPYFSQPEIVEDWLPLPGLTAVHSGEPEMDLVDLVESLAAKDVSRLEQIAGISTSAKPVPNAAPLTHLDQIPFPDFSDFPWEAYPNRIVPILTGRGCGWGVCTFCSDVVTSSGRSYRSRSPENVLAEMKEQHERYQSRLFTYLDLKLNSDLAVWRGLIESTPSIVPQATWTASVHVGAKDDQGLSLAELKKARKAGLVRMTTGLESGSPRMLAAMAKGTDPERTSEFLRNAHQAGITMRMTAIIGYPGEEPSDVEATTKFLEAHQEYVDRIVLSPFALQLGTPFHRRFEKDPAAFPQISNVRLDRRTATFDHVNSTVQSSAHRKAAFGLIRMVHRINRKPHTQYSKEFEGVM